MARPQAQTSLHDRCESTASCLGWVRFIGPGTAWAESFALKRRRLAAIAHPCFSHVAYFESTAVPGLRAKPIIDIMASVEALSAADAMLPALRTLGYETTELGFQKRRFLRKLPDPSGVACHLHIVTDAARPTENEILVRDWLITHPDAAARYQALKEALAQDHPDDMPACTAGKSDLLRMIVNYARHSRGLSAETD